MEEAKWNDLAESEAIWLFPESQINISNVILGKGAFGEVKNNLFQWNFKF